MKIPSVRTLATGAIVMLLALNLAALTWSIALLSENADTSRAIDPGEIESVVKTYIEEHPELMGAALAALLKTPLEQLTEAGKDASPARPAPEETAAKIAANARALYNSPGQITLGNPDGDVTLVEFFDYNCGFCKRALPDMQALLDTDPNLKIVLKEFPVLGPASVEAARVGIALKQQDASADRQLAFHRQMLETPGQVDRAKALAIAAALGFDAARIETGMNSDEVTAVIDENERLAGELGIAGTPNYVIGDAVIEGAVGIDALRASIADARS